MYRMKRASTGSLTWWKRQWHGNIKLRNVCLFGTHSSSSQVLGIDWKGLVSASVKGSPVS